MAHHRLFQDHSAIFSPSVARIAASTARDWSYVDNWLASKFPSRKGPLPSFERNQDTLKALLALVSLNENADEQRRLSVRADNMASLALNTTRENNDLQKRHPHNWSGIQEALLHTIEQSLLKEGQTALIALTQTAIEAGEAYPDPGTLSRIMLRLQGISFAIDQMAARVDSLERQVQREIIAAQELLRNLECDDYKPPSDLAKLNLEVQRKIKAATAQLPDLHDRVAAIAASLSTYHLSIDDVTNEEQCYIALLARKKALTDQLLAFACLPSGPDLARPELDVVRQQLRDVTWRDAESEECIERKSTGISG